MTVSDPTADATASEIGLMRAAAIWRALRVEAMLFPCDKVGWRYCRNPRVKTLAGHNNRKTRAGRIIVQRQINVKSREK